MGCSQLPDCICIICALVTHVLLGRNNIRTNYYCDQSYCNKHDCVCRNALEEVDGEEEEEEEEATNRCNVSRTLDIQCT